MRIKDFHTFINESEDNNLETVKNHLKAFISNDAGWIVEGTKEFSDEDGEHECETTLINNNLAIDLRVEWVDTVKVTKDDVWVEGRKADEVHETENEITVMDVTYYTDGENEEHHIQYDEEFEKLWEDAMVKISKK